MISLHLMVRGKWNTNAKKLSAVIKHSLPQPSAPCLPTDLFACCLHTLDLSF